MVDRLRRFLASRTRFRTASPALAAVPPDSVPKSSEAFYCDVAMKKLDAQFSFIESIDAKSTSFFTIGSTVLPITAGFVATDRRAIEDCAVAEAALFVGFACYVLLAVAFVWSFRIAGWDSRPEVLQWREVTMGRSEEEMRRWLGDALVAAYANNEPILNQKARRAGWTLWFLAGEAVSLSVAVLAPLWPPW